MTTKPTELSWDLFSAKNNAPTTAFQKLAKRYMCAECGVDSWTLEDPDGFPGVECWPFEHHGRHVSFQAKFCGTNEVFYKELEKSLAKAIEHKESGTFELDKIFVLTNRPPPVQKIKKKGGLSKNRKKEMDDLSNAAGIELVWRFGSSILEKLETATETPFVALKYFFFDPPPQPKLTNPGHESKASITEYHYSAKVIPYVHRKAVEAQLTEFAGSPELLSWCPLVGNAGVGKSRLLLQFCEGLGSDWNWGWWTKAQSFDFGQWEPDRPTLIIVDYVVGRLPEIARVFAQILAASDSFSVPVRIVLAERLEEPWLQLVCQDETIGAKVKSLAWTEEKNGTPQAIDLTDIPSDERLELAASILGLYPDTDIAADDLVKATTAVDQLCRPLFMWLVADQLSEHGKILPDVESLLRHNIDRQRANRWIPAGVSPEDEFLTSVVTLAGGMPLDPKKFLSKSCPDKLASIDTGKHETVIGRKCSDEELSPFEPDIIGELHALDVLQGKTALQPSRLPEALDISVYIDGGEGAIGFLFRAASDFPGHPVLADLGKTKLKSEWLGAVSQFLVIALTAKGPKHARSSAWEIVQALRNRLASSSPSQSLNIKRDIARCAVNISYGSEDSSDYGNVVELILEIHDYAFESSDPDLITYHSQAAKNAINNNNKKYSPETARLSIVTKWFDGAKAVTYPLEAWRQLFGAVQISFANAVNSKTKSWPDSDDPEHWFPMLAEVTELANDPVHCDVVFANAVQTSFEQLNQAGKFKLAEKYVKAVIQHIAKVGPPSQMGIASILLSDIQKMKNMGGGNPKSPHLLRSLAKYDSQAATLLPHI